MIKEEVLAELQEIEDSLVKLRKEIERVRTSNVNKNEIKDSTQKLCKHWFEEMEHALPKFGISDELKVKYHNLFSNLLSLSIRTSRKATYIKIITNILLNFKDELYITVIKFSGKILSITHLTKILDKATEQEKDYLNEALGCASHGFLRASIVLGWAAAMHRIHITIEKLGLDEFSKKTEEMKKITDGRFKRFNKSFNVNSVSELRSTVFDSDILWVLEYWGQIDANQHERLSIGFTMRNNSAHPGEAPITEENLASFYSDLKNIIFDNPKFNI